MSEQAVVDGAEDTSEETLAKQEQDLGVLRDDESDPQELSDTPEETTEQEAKEPEVDDIAVLKEKYQKLEERYKNAERLIGRKGHELAMLKASLKPAPEIAKDERTPEGFLNDFVKDPAAELKKELDRRDAARAEEAARQTETESRNVEYLQSSVPNISELTPIILELAKEDNIEHPTVSMWEQTMRREPMLALAYAKRALDRQKLNAALKKNPELFKKVAAASKSGGKVTGSSGQTSNGKPVLRRSEITALSDAELEKRLNELTK